MAVTDEDVRKLATLARIDLTDAEVEKFRGEIGSILAYIDTIRSVELPDAPKGSAHLALENVTRADGKPHESGVFTEDILSQAPGRSGGYLKVKKILG